MRWVSQALGPSWSHLVSAHARSEAGYSRPLLCCRTILTPPIVSECFPWLSAISVGLHLKPLHYGLACVATFAVLAFAFSTPPPSSASSSPHPLTFDSPVNITTLAWRYWIHVGAVKWQVQTTKSFQFNAVTSCCCFESVIDLTLLSLSDSRVKSYFFLPFKRYLIESCFNFHWHLEVRDY